MNDAAGAVRRTPNSNHGVAGRVFAVVQRDYERARIELRKLNDAMLRKNRTIATLRGDLFRTGIERDTYKAEADDAAKLLPRLAELAEQAGKLRTAEWLRTCALLPPEEWPSAPAYKGPMVPAAERDTLQARIGAALALMDYWDAHGGSIPQGHRLRAALQGDQPTEPVKRCCIGPFADGTHAVNCWQRCQDCGGDETTCRCRETSAQPTGEADRG